MNFQRDFKHLATLLGAATVALALVACGDGVGRPLVAVEEQPADAATPDGYCDRAGDWPQESESLEDGAWNLVNEFRESGWNCGGEQVGPLPLLSLDPSLRCAARLHSEDMVLRGFFDRVNPDHVSYAERIRRAGYSGTSYGESIAQSDTGFGGQVPWRAIYGLEDENCENLVDPRFDSVGIGYYEGVWTLDFGGR